MPFAQQWKDAKTKYENAVKQKKPSEKWLGHFRKSTGIESACKDLDTAIAKGDRASGEKALSALKRAGESYIGVLNKALETESAALKQIKATTLKAQLDEILIDAHNAIKGLDSGVFDQIVGPDVMTRVMGLEFPKNAFIKSFASDALFAKSGATGKPSPTVAKAQQDFVRARQVCVNAHAIFMSNKGKTLQKSAALDVVKRTLDTMFNSVGTNGMLGQCAYWEKAQVQEFGPTNRAGMDKFKKSTPMQVLAKVAAALNDDAVKLNAAKEKVKSLKV